ncbi:MAG: hypothetical protein ABF917_13555, partial [Gluconobacter oxydans]|uniref:hypothetical protein n=1 Tax=Gluconobacter oxydans TaxID=442 RepID=UPI0039E9DE45
MPEERSYDVDWHSGAPGKGGPNPAPRTNISKNSSELFLQDKTLNFLPQENIYPTISVTMK